MTAEPSTEPTSEELEPATESTSEAGVEETAEAGAGEGVEGTEPGSEGTSLLAGKYEDTPALEEGYLNLMHKNSEVEAENAELRARDGARSRQSEPSGESGKSGEKSTMDEVMEGAKADFERHWRDQNYLKAIQGLVQAGSSLSDKSSRNRVERLEGQMNQKSAEEAVNKMLSNPKRYPHLSKVEVAMGTRAEKLLAVGPGVVAAHGGWTRFFDSIYADQVQLHPELARSGRTRAAAAAGGGGSSAHVPATRPTSKDEAKKKRDAEDAKVAKSFGMKKNVFQGQKSAADMDRLSQQEGFDALSRVMSGQAR